MSARKRPSRAERINAQKAALRTRMLDMLKGANGGYSMPDWQSEESDPVTFALGTEVWGRWLAAVRLEWFQSDIAERLEHFAFRAENIHQLEIFEEAVDRFYEIGARA